MIPRFPFNARLHTNAQLYLGLVALIWALQSGVGWGWWLLSLIMLLVGTTMVSAGLHRYYSHRSFAVGPFWHYAFAFYSLMVWLGSPLQWSVLHQTHHRWADTARDPHYGPREGKLLLYLFWRDFHKVPMDFSRSKWLLQSKFQMFLHHYYGYLAFGLLALLFLISPYLAVFGMLIPGGIGLLIGGLHNYLAHWGDGKGNWRGRDWWWLEYLLPQGGDWLHGRHHDDPGRALYKQRWYELDTGGLLIKAIRQD